MQKRFLRLNASCIISQFNVNLPRWSTVISKNEVRSTSCKLWKLRESHYSTVHRSHTLRNQAITLKTPVLKAEA